MQNKIVSIKWLEWKNLMNMLIYDSKKNKPERGFKTARLHFGVLNS